MNTNKPCCEKCLYIPIGFLTPTRACIDPSCECHIPPPEWAEEFDRSFVINTIEPYIGDDTTPQEIKSFINNLLTSQKAQIRKEIEGLKIKEGNPVDGYKVNPKSTLPWNESIDHTLNLPSLQ